MLIDLNPEFQKALDVLEHTGSHAFITGKAGTGKSTLLEYFRSHTKKRMVVLAPTGVSALNVRGETIHSFFGFKPDITVEKVRRVRGKTRRAIFRNIDGIIIDEISMVRADLLDCVDAFLRLNGPDTSQPFGGLQMVFIGDLYQLPPVVPDREARIFETLYPSPYFFDAHALRGLPLVFLELEKIYRQKEQEFIELLNGIRNNLISDAGLATLNHRAGAVPGEGSGYAVHLTTTNARAAVINAEHLHRLEAKEHVYAGRVEGDFDERLYPTGGELRLKPGAQVMLLNNDAENRWVNGSIGKVLAIEPDGNGTDVLTVCLSDESIVEVKPHTWELFHFNYDEESRTITTEELGSFTQYPLRLAWALTIHKSQGKTFDRVNIDFGRGVFACGQAYVALSRCTSFEGVTLARPLRRSEIFVDPRIVKFMTELRYRIAEEAQPLAEKVRRIEAAIASGANLEIVYLKANDEKSRRVIKPLSVGQQTYGVRKFLGVKAHCYHRNEPRVFKLDRILECVVI